MSSELWARRGELGVRSFRYFCFHQHSYFRLANIQPFPNTPTPRPFLSSPHPLHRYLTAHCSLLIAHYSLLIASHRYLTTHCSLLIAHCSLRRTVTFIAIACRQYYKKKPALSPITTFPLWESAYWLANNKSVWCISECWNRCRTMPIPLCHL